MKLEDVGDDMLRKIFDFGNHNLKFGNHELYDRYLESGYLRVKSLVEKIFIIPEYNGDINWCYIYHNIIYYNKYYKLVTEKYPYLTPSVFNMKYDIDQKNWKIHYDFLVKNKLQTFMTSENFKSANNVTIEDFNLTFFLEEVLNLTEIHDLNFGNNLIPTIPPEIERLKSLVNLYLNNNKLTRLPKEISKLNKLKRLSLNNNNLSELPLCICNLSELIILHIANNKITKLPEEIGNLTKLDELTINSNFLTTLPQNIGMLTNLTLLNCMDNELYNLPDSICNLSRLTHFYLNGNKLISLPESMSMLTMLEVLELTNNKLTLFKYDYLQDIFPKLTKLRVLSLIGNNIYYSYYWKSTYVILEYFTNTGCHDITFHNLGAFD